MEDVASGEHAWSLSLGPHPVSECWVAMASFLAFEQRAGYLGWQTTIFLCADVYRLSDHMTAVLCVPGYGGLVFLVVRDA